MEKSRFNRYTALFEHIPNMRDGLLLSHKKSGRGTSTSPGKAMPPAPFFKPQSVEEESRSYAALNPWGFNCLLDNPLKLLSAFGTLDTVLHG